MEKSIKGGFQFSDTNKITGVSFMTKDGKWHFMPSIEFRDKYLSSYIDAVKTTRPVSKITKELKSITSL